MHLDNIKTFGTCAEIQTYNLKLPESLPYDFWNEFNHQKSHFLKLLKHNNNSILGKNGPFNIAY